MGIQKNNVKYYGCCFIIFIILYYLALNFIFPGHFEPLIPHHSDMLDYPYDINMLEINKLFINGIRPIGLFLTYFFGLFGYKGVVLSGILVSILSILLIIRIYELELGEKPSVVAVIIYGIALFTNSGFYLNYSYDIYSTYSLVFSLGAILLWYELRSNKNNGIMYILITFMLFFAFMSKETYPISIGLFFLYKSIFDSNRENKKSAKIIVLILIFSFIISILQSNIAGSAFVSLSKDSNSAYHANFNLGIILNILKYYIGGFFNIPILILIILSLNSIKTKENFLLEKSKYIIWILMGIAAYIPYCLLPNHVIPHYYYLGCPMGYSVLLLLFNNNSNEKKQKIAIRYCIIVALLTSSIFINFQDKYMVSKSWLKNEQAMKKTIESINMVDKSIESGDKILVLGLEDTVETIYRSIWYLDNKIKKDVDFYVVTNEPTFTGTFGEKVKYITNDEIITDQYDMVINYKSNLVEIIRK